MLFVDLFHYRVVVHPLVFPVVCVVAGMLKGVLSCCLVVIGRPLIYKDWVLGSAVEQCIVIAFSCLISPRPGLSIYPREGTNGTS